LAAFLVPRLVRVTVLRCVR